MAFRTGPSGKHETNQVKISDVLQSFSVHDANIFNVTCLRSFLNVN